MNEQAMPEQAPMMEPQQEQQGPQMLSDDDEKDIDIVAARAMEFFEENEDGGPPAIEEVANIMAGENPEQMFAIFLSSMMEAIHTEAMEGEFDINPIIWFAENGALDEIAADIEEKMGGEFDITGMMPAVKDKMRQILQKRGEQLKGQMGGQAPQQVMPDQSAQPPQPRTALMAGA